jgi:protein-L-isoaspartate(D-aspartate) O-methyltransferase
MAYVDFLSSVHKATKRDYVARVTEFPKAEAAKLGKQWGKDYWDGDRRTGYGGYAYDGRWRKVADAMVAHYGIKPGDRILDVGCGKGFLLYDLTQSCPGVEVAGIDVSRYALEHAKEEVKPFLGEASAAKLPPLLVWNPICVPNPSASYVVTSTADDARVILPPSASRGTKKP